MEKKFYITCDSSCDLTKEYLIENDVKLVGLRYTIDDKEYTDDLSVDAKEYFYKRYREGSICKTGCYNQEDCKVVWENIDMPILHIAISSGLSNSYEHAYLMSQNTTDKKVMVLDSLMASLGTGMMVIDAIKLRDEGKSLEEAYEAIKTKLLSYNAFYTTDTLEYFYRGGRIKKSAAVFGKLLHINPILTVKSDGTLSIDKKIRGTKHCETELINIIKETAIDPANNTLYLCQTDCLAEATILAEKIKNEVGFKDVFTTLMGPTIGTHTGPGLKAFFYYGIDRP